MSLEEIRQVKFIRPRLGIMEAWLRLCFVDDIQYLRTAMAAWTVWAADHKASAPSFNWVSVSNFQADQGSRFFCLDGTDQLIVHESFHVSQGAPSAEALMFVRTGHIVRCDAGHRTPLVYIGFLEVAPWNHPRAPSRHFKALGPLLIRAACSLSVERGHGGRVGLHAVAAAEAFYERLGFRSMDCPNEYNELYMELDEAGAQALLRG